MKTKTEIMKFALRGMLIGAALAFAPLVVVAQSDEHAGHAMPPAAADPHAGHMMAPSQDGPWSYMGRENPKPYTQERWEMVPSSKNGAQFIAADALSPQARCAALRDHGYMAVDRATRAACAQRPAPVSAPPAEPQPGHQH